MAKSIITLHGAEAREKLITGANFLADVVKLTLGSHGRNAAMEKGARITNDGVSIAKEIQLDDPIEDLGLRMIREACVRTVEEVGDGTTTAITLAQAILVEAQKFLPSSDKSVIQVGKKSPPEIKNQIISESKEIVEKLKAMAIPVTSREQLIEVTMVSVEDQNLADLIGGTQWELGQYGVIQAEESNDRIDSVIRVPGIRTDNGYAATSMINNQEKQTLELRDVPILVTSHSITDIASIIHIIQPIVDRKQYDIVILARAFTQEAINQILKNWRPGEGMQPIRIYPINAPYFDSSEVMKDIAASMGATFIDSEGMKLEDVQLSDIGSVDYLEAGRWTTEFRGKDTTETQALVTKRVEELKKQSAGSQSEFEKKNIQARIAQLSNGFAVIKVGGSSQSDKKYKKDKIDDAVNATRAALEEGVVRGGGLALKEISEALPDTFILKNAILAPYKQILANGCPSIPENIYDPVKVTRVALERAAAVAAPLATAEIAIAERRKTRLEKLFTDKQVAETEE